MSTLSLQPRVERFVVAKEELSAVQQNAARECKFALRRSEAAGKPPLFTYFGIDVTRISQASADALTAASHISEDVAEGFDAVPFKGGIFIYLPYDDSVAAEYWLIERMIVVDHVNSVVLVVALHKDDVGGSAADLINYLSVSFGTSQPTGDTPASEWTVDIRFDEYKSRVAEIHTRIEAGELRQAILSVGLSKATVANAEAIFEAMLRRNASPHIFLVRTEKRTLIGASPAMHMRKTGSQVIVETDAGTRRLGDTEEGTLAIMNELLNSAKDIEEQKMIVDETIIDLQAIAEAGKVDMPVELEVRRLGNVMHLFTVLAAQVRTGFSPLQAVLSCFPSSAVTGAPRPNAMKVIKEVERTPRGLYGGVVGLLGFDGSVDTAIILRSAWIEGNTISMRCGGGITHASADMDEYNECMNKAKSLIDCVREAESN